MLSDSSTVDDGVLDLAFDLGSVFLEWAWHGWTERF